MAILIGVGGWWVLDRAEIINPPSDEMRVLRTVEATLGLPEPYQRTETDRGCYRDWKGADQCSRHIFFFYETDEYWPALAGRLASAGWPSYQPSPDGDFTFDRAWNGDPDRPVCLSHHTDGITSSVFLSSLTDAVCATTIQVLVP